MVQKKAARRPARKAGKKTELKTKPTGESVEAFLRTVADPARRKDCRAVVDLMKKATKSEPRMWGKGMIGFGEVHYKYASGHEGDTFRLGFAPRKDTLTIYTCAGLERFADLLARLGKHKAGKGCLHIRSLDEIDVATLKKLLAGAAAP